MSRREETGAGRGATGARPAGESDGLAAGGREPAGERPRDGSDGRGARSGSARPPHPPRSPVLPVFPVLSAFPASSVQRTIHRLVRRAVGGEDIGGHAGAGGERQENVLVADAPVLPPHRDPQRPRQDALRPAAERAVPRPARSTGPVQHARAVGLLDTGDDRVGIDAGTGERVRVGPGRSAAAARGGRIGFDRRPSAGEAE